MIRSLADAVTCSFEPKEGGKYRVKLDQATTVGTINGGGPDMTFKTVNGNVYIRSKK